MTTNSLSPLIAKRHTRNSLSAGACLVGVLGATSMQAGAAPITILNHSFETTAGAVNNLHPTDWLPYGFSEGTRTYGPLVTIAPIDGVRELAFNNHYSRYQTSQTTDFTVTSAGQVLTLTVQVGNYTRPYQVGSGGGMKAAHYFGTINLQLVDGNDVAVDVATNTADNLNSFTPTAPEASFADAWLTYTTTSADIGKLVGVHFNIGPELNIGTLDDPIYINTKSAYFDNVRLDVAAIPEPATLALMALAVAFVGFRRIMRRKRATS